MILPINPPQTPRVHVNIVYHSKDKMKTDRRVSVRSLRSFDHGATPRSFEAFKKKKSKLPLAEVNGSNGLNDSNLS